MPSLSANLYGSSINKGVGGLMSGLDTDDLVNQMTAATRNKINRQYQSKQKLLYRQEAYREISTKLLSFSKKYFSYSSGTKNNILSPMFFQSYTYKSSSNYVNVTGNAENIKNFSINEISQVATAASFASTNRVSSDIITSAELTDYTSTIAGGTMTIEYDGKSYSLSIDKGFGNNNNVDGLITLDDVAEQLNSKLERLDLSTLSATASDGKISINSSDGKEVKLTAASSSIMESLKFEVGKDVASASGIDISTLTKDTFSILSNENSHITFEYNGILKQINLNENIDKTNIVEYLQTEINKGFGADKVSVGLDANNNLSFSVNDGSTNIFGISSISEDLSLFLNIESGDYNRLNGNKTLEESGLMGINDVSTIERDGKEFYRLTINDVDIDFETTMSVTDIINKINSNAEAGIKVYYSSTTDTFTVKSTETGSHKGVTIVAGDKSLAQALFGSGVLDLTGTDTIMTYTLNGVETTISRSTTNFTIDDINIELNEKAKGLEKTDTPISFDVINNSDEVVERVKQFINDYNEIISLIGTNTSEKPSRNYLPLTPEQQDEMKEEEIKNWTKEAKKGILYGDRKMNTVLRNMREAMSGFTDVSSLTLSNLGISAANMDTSGKLVIDEKKFKEKLLENPDEIARLFTNTSMETDRSGISIQLQAILQKNVGAYGTTGLLIEEAGMANSMTSDKNYISEKIKQHDDKMAQLKEYLERERQRCWNQFSALEQSLNKLNAQSGWLTDMMGGY